MSAATDNVGLFYGEDIFIAISSILLIQGALKAFGIELTPFELSVWAIPSAICAFLIQSARLLWMDRALARHPRESGGPASLSGAGKKQRDSRFRGNDEA
jgi:uncharacterized membrane protein